ncbi:Autoinducer 2 (AI-2) ABC transport system, membrane channel protein LsrC [Vibrio chagasii]|nr:Autoinducer 2 (AI-2) ABC transport system, membrane channel protein LsrC [Vibrio chagasii]CAH7238503.1 Autoinducer 2 (AI-2) ABC transport system, membrane channel protein LsrC [Vibrio chagasii]CAH7258960.1 Autoinducer 2 (AI-2) ABC transport system, membrane channel protein LsrC [Vibrio chagasii]CAH7285591.1 Autoinducer 2 (AI-2) ABC transport system, membrane channel protein LsrC [Vibrio chagasii]CAH7377249.1 Autoinducer 2 (AI-2) ABC transport system, membrane channel protein LsrC [Vibrio cha
MGLVDNRVGLGAKLQVLATCIVGSWSLLSQMIGRTVSERRV